MVISARAGRSHQPCIAPNSRIASNSVLIACFFVDGDALSSAFNILAYVPRSEALLVLESLVSPKYFTSLST
ncbi:hypothetical protein SRCM100623_01724 [Acetobacter pasteurianus]|uniref:Uncharacterized protein n=1 Tax=Acetobacter pasteurianus TaxID=438 RepID=A0A1A0DAU0_ACEPA|nr:hypothetical protein SRCM100623_01724 [Acetobacter pasteurianus]GCD48760.1 hypothetical protein NBRC106471_0316 [Acetobacter pasteurianus subsp. pasteurianus LMG 1262 = NBRC 106471]